MRLGRKAYAVPVAIVFMAHFRLQQHRAPRTGGHCVQIVFDGAPVACVLVYLSLMVLPRMPVQFSPAPDAVKPWLQGRSGSRCGQRCICKFISSVCGIKFSFKLAMITRDPARTRNTMSTPNASARTLLVLSGPVVM